MNLIIKGFIVGIGKIIPGVSGSMLAITLGIYEKLLESISNIKKEFKKNATFITKVGLGIILAIILTSKLVVKCLNTYYLPTMLLFIGMIIGSMPKLIKEIKLEKKDIITIIISLTLITLIIITTNTKINNNHNLEYTILEFIKIIGIGIVDAASSIIPGISGTALLMMLGYYDIILNTFGSILNTKFIMKNIFVLTPFIIGFILGTVIISKIITILFKNHKKTAYIIITLFTLSTIIILLKNINLPSYNPKEIILSTPLLIIGYYISTKLETKE